MSAKACREYYGKRLLANACRAASSGEHDVEARGVLVTPDVLDAAKPISWESIAAENPWVNEVPLVAKPDQLIKRRGKAGLVLVNKSYAECKAWILEKMEKVRRRRVELQGSTTRP